MDLRKELIDYTKYIMDEITDGDIATINAYIANRRSINCDLDETQTVRQNEQTKKVCVVCQDHFLADEKYHNVCPWCSNNP